MDTFTSLLSSVTIFGILGNLAFQMNVDPSEVISSGGGTGLAFISYPDIISKFQTVPWVTFLVYFKMCNDILIYHKFSLNFRFICCMYGAFSKNLLKKSHTIAAVTSRLFQLTQSKSGRPISFTASGRGSLRTYR